MPRFNQADLDQAQRDFDLVGYINGLAEGVDLRQVTGGEFMGRCPFHGGRSFSVSPASKTGSRPLFKCFGCGEGGDPIRFIEKIHNVDFLEAVKILTGGKIEPVSEDVIAERRREEKIQADIAEKRRRDKIAGAGKIWKAAAPIEGTPAEAYLIGRGLRPPFPPSLRFAEKLKCRWLDPDTGKNRSRHFPAMIACVQRGREFLTVHRIYLAKDGAGKAPVPADDQKKLYGASYGGAVLLDPPADHLILTEGIETGLAVRQAMRAKGEDCAVWSVISAGGLTSVSLGDYRPMRITIAADNDGSKIRNGREVGHAGAIAAQKACRRFQDMGLEAVWKMPERVGDDWLDVLIKGGVHD